MPAEPDQHRIIAIGGSAGSIEALKELCRSFPPELAATVCIVVHVGNRGRDILASIFDRSCPIRVSTADDGERLLPSRAYVAPADRHLIVVDGTVRLGHGPRENLARPS